MVMPAPPVRPLTVNQTRRTFSCGQMLPLEPDILWKIERGIVRTFTWNEDGRSITLGYWGSGEIVGQALSRIQPYQIECLTSAEVSILPTHIWYQAIDGMISHIQRSEELLAIIHSRPVNLRLLEILHWLAQRFGREVDRGKLIEVPLTHQALSEIICTTRVTVTRLLNEFEQKSLISRHGRYLIVCQRSPKLDV